MASEARHRQWEAKMIVEVSTVTWIVGGVASFVFTLLGYIFISKVSGIQTEMKLIREILVNMVDSVQNELTDHKNDDKRHL